MSDAAQRLEQELLKVAAVFDARLPERLQLLERLWQAYERTEGTEVDSADALRRELHRLRGTAASYGYQALSQQLRDAEDQLRQEARAPLHASMLRVFSTRWQRDTPLV